MDRLCFPKELLLLIASGDIARLDHAFVVQFATGPKETAADELHVAIIFDRLIVVAEGGVKNASFVGSELIRPSDHCMIYPRLITGVLFAVGERLGAGPSFEIAFKAMDVVVEFLIDGGPIAQAFDNGVIFRSVSDSNGLLRAMARRLEAEQVKPLRFRGIGAHGLLEVTAAIGMHGAVQIDSGNTIAMGVDDVIDRFGIGDVSGAFIVDHDIIFFCPVGILINGELRSSRAICRVFNGDLAVNARLNAFCEQKLLFAVVVAATADDEQDFEWFDFCCASAKACDGTGEENEFLQHNVIGIT